jgi:hypothetical protein
VNLSLAAATAAAAIAIGDVISSVSSSCSSMSVRRGTSVLTAPGGGGVADA